MRGEQNNGIKACRCKLTLDVTFLPKENGILKTMAG